MAKPVRNLWSVMGFDKQKWWAFSKGLWLIAGWTWASLLGDELWLNQSWPKMGETVEQWREKTNYFGERQNNIKWDGEINKESNSNVCE